MLNMQYFETLPPQCPEPGSEPPVGPVFRLVNDPPSDRDFLSQRALQPQQVFNATECRARSVSVFLSVDGAKRIQLLPAHSTKVIARINLDAQSGLLKKTGKDSSHFSWWRSAQFDHATSSSKVPA
jgi:hypothetical protein